MARAAALRRDETWEAASVPSSGACRRLEPILIPAPANQLAGPGASPDIEAIKAAILLCARRDHLALDAEAPIPSVPASDPVSIDVPPVETADRELACPVPLRARRITLGLAASLFLHIAAAAAALYLGLSEPPASATADDSVAVEVVAGLPGAAAVQDQASGREDTDTPNASAEQRNVEAPPVETPRVEEADPAAKPGDEPPVAQPDPVTSAQTVLDIPPPPPAPEMLAITTEPVPPPPVVAVQDTPPPPLPQPEQRVETEAPSPVLAMVTPQQPVPPVVQPHTPPRETPQPVATPQPVQTRRPPTRREAPTTRQQVRPTRQVAATPSPERASRREAPAPSRAASAPRGEGTGQQNSQASNGQGATGGAASASAVASWRAQVLAHLARFKVYPNQARDRGITGRAAIAFTLSRGGQVTASSLAGSSGAAILDQATIAMLRRAQPFPPMPAGGPASMSFTAGINYSLR
ncbi:TonB family protein [Phreatobacter aquaticus]|uniref:TonB family protein n=1 Tax=Phreatobacter aquaticus TaxID=2570229 RepID=A0A4D7QS64_9HYPH|nr:energy transducer TonB [Phreatobacter aquaticus]QCK86932.1 TonB family protein [Phreatobacter aquaticus]